ncbi:DNA repair protein SWI5 homolog [Belonocnema kinseyi]|uniref:DNA repair protein SWI5 homolog n=1 Tax=Belonocnema kinseyi TaxID=2817044 RepID=UPI00143CE041|nr:DNA repair protein SWI5 homolog [Belonocnema kinseyi]XP_033215270.1 DNA repair protein SWI5 homolog [Belonocnema kinseyi]
MTSILENTKQAEEEIEASMRLRLSEDTVNNSSFEEEKSESAPPELTPETDNEDKNNSTIDDEPPTLIPEIIQKKIQDLESKEVKEFVSNLSPKVKNSQENPLTEKEEEEYFKLVKLEEELDDELSKLKTELDLAPSKETTMNYLHEYNNIKDATQVVLSALATMREVTIASLHQEFNLPITDE